MCRNQVIHKLYLHGINAKRGKTRTYMHVSFALQCHKFLCLSVSTPRPGLHEQLVFVELGLETSDELPHAGLHFGRYFTQGMKNQQKLTSLCNQRKNNKRNTCLSAILARMAVIGYKRRPFVVLMQCYLFV